MPRHTEPPGAPDGPGPSPSAREVAGWVAFLVPVTVALMLWTGAGWVAAVLVAVLGTICGGVLWWLGGGPTGRTGPGGGA